MYRQCDGEWSMHICRMAATLYYGSVRMFGSAKAARDVKEVNEALRALEALQEREINDRYSTAGVV